MDAKEYELFRSLSVEAPTLSVDDLVDKSDRTLVYGYFSDRTTFHLYLKDGRIHRICYRGSSSAKDYCTYVKYDKILLDMCYPSKRVYPAMSDFEFCSMLKVRGVWPSYTTFTEVEEKRFYGFILEDFKV